MKYLPVGKKYRQCNVKSCTNLSLPSGLDEGVYVFVQTFALDSFCVFQIHLFLNLQLVVVGKPLVQFSLDCMLGVGIEFTFIIPHQDLDKSAVTPSLVSFLYLWHHNASCGLGKRKIPGGP